MPQLRRNPLTQEWVIVAKERKQRSEFAFHRAQPVRQVSMDPKCPFCEGNENITPHEILAYRGHGTRSNGPGWRVRTVPNKYPALQIEGELDPVGQDMFDTMNGIGAHEVIIDCPQHNLSIADISLDHAEEALWMARERCLDLSFDKRFKYLALFRNHGVEAGATQPHTHSQLIAMPVVPIDVKRMVDGFKRYKQMHERCIICDMLKAEERAEERIVCSNEHFVAFCPFASGRPYEIWIVPKRHHAGFLTEERSHVRSLAAILAEVLRRLRSTLGDPPFNYAVHSAPINLDKPREFHWHLAIIPRITSDAGLEMGAGVHINSVPAEAAALDLRSVPAGVLC